MKLQRGRSAHKAMAILLAMTVFSCARPFTKEQRRMAADVDFAELWSSPDAYEGAVVIYGGDIIFVINRESVTEIVVLQKPLDHWKRPKATDRTSGRFIFVSSDYLDPAIYSVGRKITVIGTVKGMERRQIGDLSYPYPIIEEIDHRLWEHGAPSPDLRFGIGIRVGNSE